MEENNIFPASINSATPLTRRLAVKSLLGVMLTAGLAACGQGSSDGGNNNPIAGNTPSATKPGTVPTSGPTAPAQTGKRAIGDTITIYREHKKVVTQLVWSPNGKQIATASEDGTVQIWDPFSGKQLLAYKGHGEARVFGLAWSPDGKRIVSGGDQIGEDTSNTTVHIWDPTTGKLIYTYGKFTGAVYTLAWSHNGRFIVGSGHPTRVRIWQASDGYDIKDFAGGAEDGETLTLSWSPNDDVIAYASSNTPEVRNSADKIFALRGHTDFVSSINWSPDGKYLASAGDTSVRIWDAQTDKQVFMYKSDYRQRDAAWSWDSKQIASGGDTETVEIWDPKTGAVTFTYKGHQESIGILAWSPDNTMIASASNDSAVQVWQAR